MSESEDCEADSELLGAAEAVHDGWFPDGRIDWQDFLDRLETYADVDLGSDMLSPQIVAIKKHVNRYRKSS